MSAMALRPLEDETWGERLRRARERSRERTGGTLLDTSKRISVLFPVSPQTLNRLEKLEDPPDDWRRRIIAYLTVVAYGYNPADFGLEDNILPIALSPKKVRELVAPRATALRTASGRSPSAGSGSSPRRSGCSPGQFVKAA